LVLGDATTARDQTLAGLTSTGLGGNVVGANASTNSLLTLNIASGTNTYGGVLGGGGTNENKLALTKSGNGTLELTGASTYTGATTVSAGKLIITGNISTSSLTTVSSGATLAGSGTVGKAQIDGTLAVGNSPGTMNFTDTLGLNGITVMEIDGMSGAGVTGGHDFINLTGAGAAGVLTYGATLTLDMGFTFGMGSYSWNLFNMASETGTFTTISLADHYSGSLLDTDLNGVWDLTSDDNTWQFTESTGVLGLTVIPEPNVAALLGGLGMFLLLRRRRAS
jgi:autotransporter-associated beta strand protein